MDKNANHDVTHRNESSQVFTSLDPVGRRLNNFPISEQIFRNMRHIYRINFALYTKNVYKRKNIFFSPRIVPIWNSLPQQFVSASSTAKFKSLITNHDLSFFSQSSYIHSINSPTLLNNVNSVFISFRVFICMISEYHSSRFDLFCSDIFISF